jgi:hypothetical protein
LSRLEIGVIIALGGSFLKGAIQALLARRRAGIDKPVTPNGGEWNEVLREPRRDDPTRFVSVERRIK